MEERGRSGQSSKAGVGQNLDEIIENALCNLHEQIDQNLMYSSSGVIVPEDLVMNIQGWIKSGLTAGQIASETKLSIILIREIYDLVEANYSMDYFDEDDQSNEDEFNQYLDWHTDHNIMPCLSWRIVSEDLIQAIKNWKKMGLNADQIAVHTNLSFKFINDIYELISRLWEEE